MAMLMLASRIHSIPAAIHSTGERGMAMSASDASDRAREEVRPAPAEPVPGAIRVVADDGLHDQTR